MRPIRTRDQDFWMETTTLHHVLESHNHGGTAMLADRRATAMLPAKDLNRARAWYADKLGLRPSEENGEMGAVYTLGGGLRAFMYPTQFAGTAQHTLFSFDSTDLVADMAALRAKGGVCLDYDLSGLKTDYGLASFVPVKIAWCK